MKKRKLKKYNKRYYRKSPHFEKSKIEKVDIHYGDRTIIDQSKQYKGEIRDVAIYEMISPFLIKNLGEKKLGISGLISLILGIIQIFIWVNSSTNIQLFSYLPQVAKEIALLPLVGGIVLSAIGIIFIGSIVHFQETKCERCGRHFSYYESEKPTVREVESHDGVHITTKRKYKCKNCGHEKTVEETDFVEYEED